MKRRKFIVLGGAAGSSISWPLSARAQQHERVRRIGVIMGFVVALSRGRKAAFPFGPALCAGAYLVVLLSNRLIS